MRELDDETLGWFSRKLPWGTYGMLCRASLSAPNLGIALRRWFRHHLLVTDDIELTLTLSPERIATVSVLERREFNGMREICLLSYLRFVHGYACWAIDSRIPLLQTSLPFARPQHGDLYASLFPGPVEFDAAHAGFSFDAKYLALAHQRDEIALRTMLQRPLSLSIRPYRRDRLLVQRIRTAMNAFPNGVDDAEAVARHLHVSTRTMYRQLREEGTSFQAIKDEVRREQAIHFLCRTDKPVKQIALTLGFSGEKSFSRAFRDWTGMTPNGYRQQAT